LGIDSSQPAANRGPVQLRPVLSQPAGERPLSCWAERPHGRRRGAMPSSSGAERCLLAPRNINDSNSDYELTWRSWGSRKHGSAHRATASLFATALAPALRFHDHGRLRRRAGATSAADQGAHARWSVVVRAGREGAGQASKPWLRLAGRGARRDRHSSLTTIATLSADIIELVGAHITRGTAIHSLVARHQYWPTCKPPPTKRHRL
jgi:hypothetical protein